MWFIVVMLKPIILSNLRMIFKYHIIQSYMQKLFREWKGYNAYNVMSF